MKSIYLNLIKHTCWSMYTLVFVTTSDTLFIILSHQIIIKSKDAYFFYLFDTLFINDCQIIIKFKGVYFLFFQYSVYYRLQNIINPTMHSLFFFTNFLIRGLLALANMHGGFHYSQYRFLSSKPVVPEFVPRHYLINMALSNL